MTYKCFSNQEGHDSSAAGNRREPKRAEKPDLGALKLSADEIAQFEKWMTSSLREPTQFMLQAAKTHRMLQAKLKR